MTEGSHDASHKPQFFRILFPNFSTMLPLPRAFVKKHITREEEKDVRVTLLSPKGKTWNISLHTDKKSQHTYFSGNEWRACTEAHDLKVGFFLLFCYEGHMVFSFTVYDLTTCKKAYPSPTPVSATFATASDGAKTNKPCKKGHRFEMSAKGCIRGSITSCCKDCKCFRFEASMTRLNLSYSYMRIPSAFMKLSALSEQHRLTLVDPRGRSWPIGLVRKKLFRQNTYESVMSTGWLKFVHGNRFQLGDRCAFELQEGDKDVMHVQMLKAYSPQSPPPPVSATASEKAYPLHTVVTATRDAMRIKTCEGHRLEKAGKNHWQGSITGYCEECKCFRFEESVAKTCLSNYTMHMPASFMALSGLSKEQHRHKLTLVDPKGRSWPVRLRHKQNKRDKSYYSCLGLGKEFFHHYRLELGDRCSFELEEGCKDVMRIQMLNS